MDSRDLYPVMLYKSVVLYTESRDIFTADYSLAHDVGSCNDYCLSTSKCIVTKQSAHNTHRSPWDHRGKLGKSLLVDGIGCEQ